MRRGEGRGVTGERDDQGVMVARRTVKLPDFAGNALAGRRSAVWLVARAPADLLARCGEDPVRADGRRGRVACPRVGVDSEKAPQLIGRDTRVRLHLNEVETVKVEREV